MTARLPGRIPPESPQAAPKRPCDVEGCGRDHYARGLCHRHYVRVRRTGNPGPPGDLIRAPGRRRPDSWAARTG